MVPRKLRLFVAGLVAVLMGMPLAGSADAASRGVFGIIDSSLGLGFSIASLAGRS